MYYVLVYVLELEEAMVRNYTKSYDRYGGHLNFEWRLQADLGHI